MIEVCRDRLTLRGRNIYFAEWPMQRGLAMVESTNRERKSSKMTTVSRPHAPVAPNAMLGSTRRCVYMFDNNLRSRPAVLDLRLRIKQSHPVYSLAFGSGAAALASLFKVTLPFALPSPKNMTSTVKSSLCISVMFGQCLGIRTPTYTVLRKDLAGSTMRSAGLDLTHRGRSAQDGLPRSCLQRQTSR
jgi:hypothetical protein